MTVRQKQAQLSRRQMAFIREYEATNGNGTQAARRAGYSDSSDKVLSQQAYENLRKPGIIAALAARDEEIAKQITPFRVKRRLHEISLAAQDAGQFGPSVRAEELLGKSIGMWIDQSLHLSGVLRDEHVLALLDLARRRQGEVIDNSDDDPRNASTHDDDER